MNRRARATKYIIISSIIMLGGMLALYLKSVGIIRLACPINEFTGLNCPGCGGTRMVSSILALDIYQAFRYNPFIVVSIPYIVYLYIMCGISYINTGRVNDKLAKQILVYGIALIIFGIIRNISWFEALAPTRLM